LESFKQPGLDERIAALRFQHFDEKRKGTIKLICDTLKNGMVDQLENYHQGSLHKS
jgi:hypothetical protein